MRKKVLSSIMLIVLFLLPIFVEAFSVDRDLGIGEYYAAYRTADVGWRIEGSFSVDNDIEFFICDANNYTRWNRQDTVLFFEHSETTSGQSFNFTVPYDSTWYVVFSNVQQDNVASLEAEFFYIDQSDITHTQVTWITQSSILTPLFVGTLFAMLIVCLLGIWISRKKEQFPAVKYDKILSGN